jgi:hypothetical protein
MKKIAILIIFLLVASVCGATTYYVDATDGNDSKSGESAELAWKTIGKVEASSGVLQAGDSILFQCGETWVETTAFELPEAGTDGHITTYGNYGTGDNPIITTMGEVSGWDVSGNWTDDTSNKWHMAKTGSPGRLEIDGSEVLMSHNATDLTSSEPWYWDSNVLYLYSTSNPAENYSSIQCPQVATCLDCYRNYVTIDGLDIRGASTGSGIRVLGVHDITIQNCDIGKYCYHGIIVTDAGDTTAAQDVVISSNTIDSGFAFSYADSDSTRGCRDGIIFNDGVGNCTISDNTISDWGHSGINFYTLSDVLEGVNENEVYDNLITAANISYGRGIETTGKEGKCQYNKFYRNIIRDTTVRNQINGNNNSFYYNIIDTVTNSPASASSVGQGFYLECPGTDYANHDNKFYNNVILNTQEAGIELYESDNDKKDNIFKNNILYNCGVNATSNTNAAIIIDDHTSIKENTYTNNCIYSADPKILYRDDCSTIAEFNAFNGDNNDTITDNISGNPLFTDAANDDFTLQAGSPCIGAGEDLGTTFEDALSPDSVWPDGVVTVRQGVYKGWEIGAYIWPYGGGYKIW